MTLQTQVSTLETNLALVQREHERTRQEAQQEFDRIRQEQYRREEQLKMEDAQRKLNDERNQMQMDFMMKDFESKLENTKLKGDMELERQSSAHREKIRDVQQEHERQVRQLQDEMRSRFENLQKQHQEQIDSITKEANRQIDEERTAKAKEVSELKSEAEKEMAKLEAMMNGSGEEIRRLRGEIQSLQMDLNNERMTNRSLMEKLQEAASNSVKMEQNAQAL